jgi:phospholipase C
MENKDYGAVIGSRKAPYENTLARRCGLATDYYGVTHPSLPNYLAAMGGATFGVHDDAGPAAHRVAGDSLFGQLARKGLAWREYEESMHRPCAKAPAGSYAVKHNPAAYFTRIRSACRHNDVALEGHLARALRAGRLPAFSFVTPNLCHDTHDCSVAVGDAWLKEWVTRIVRSRDYRSGRTLVVVTWDEGVGRTNRVPTLVIGRTVPAAARSSSHLDHYSLLRATEDVLGLAHLGHARTAHSMTTAFHLTE